MKQKTNKVKLLISIVLLVLFASIACFPTNREDQSIFRLHNLRDYAEGWSEKTNGNVIVLHNQFTDLDRMDELCFSSRNTNFKVYINEEEVYSYFPKLSRIFGKTYGTTYHAVEAGHAAKVSVKIEIYPIYKDNSWNIGTIYLGSSGAYFRELLIQKFPIFLINVIIIALSAAIFVITGLLKNKTKEYNTTKYLTLCTIFCCQWIIINSSFLQVLFGDTAFIHSIGYFVVIILPYLFISFLYSIFVDARVQKAKNLTKIISVALITVNLVSTMAGFKDYHELLSLTHIYLIISIVCFFIIVFYFYFKAQERDEYLWLMLGFGSVAVGTVIDVIRYRFFTQENTGVCIRISLVVAVILVGRFIIWKIVKVMVLGYENEVIRNMAFTDELTGLFNRTAFKKDKNEILQKHEQTDYGIIQFDINNLKQVNDTKGHAYGDKYIVQGAKILKQSFGNIGVCYRIGGDEFIAIIQGKNVEESWNEVKKKILDATNYYNESNHYEQKMEFAWGIAIYHPDDNQTMNEIMEQADAMMYRNKKKMKKMYKKS